VDQGERDESGRAVSTQDVAEEQQQRV
jgi:hypothetical protein